MSKLPMRSSSLTALTTSPSLLGQNSRPYASSRWLFCSLPHS
jgi:hypothetical protein